MSGRPLNDCELAARLLQGHSLAELAAAYDISAACMREHVAALLDRVRLAPVSGVQRTPPDTAGSPQPDG